MKLAQLRAWIKRGGDWGFLAVGVLLGLHHLWYRKRGTVIVVAALSFVGLAGVLLRPHPASYINTIAPSPGASPAPRPAEPHADYGVLAYVQDGNVYILELPNGKPKQIARQRELETPRWSPTGKWLLFQQHSRNSDHGQERSVVVRRDGTDLREVCQGENVAWAGHDDEVAFEEKGAIWLARAPNFRWQYLARMPKEDRNDRIDFEVSPDKQRIAFRRWWINWNREGTNWDRGNGVLWVENTDGTHRRMLYDSHGRTEDLPTLGGWSPDSRYVFMGTWVYQAMSGNLDGTLLFVFDVRTGKQRSLAPNAVMKHFDWYAYSADGHKIVVVDGGDRWGSDAKTLLVVDPQTWQSHPITREAVDSLFPAWSPDGGRLAFIENNAYRVPSGDEDSDDYHSRLCVMNADGTHVKRLTPNDGYGDWDPMWCGDRRHLLFIRLGKSNQAAFWLIREDGQELHKLADGPEFPGDDHWTDAYDFWAAGRGWNHR